MTSVDAQTFNATAEKSQDFEGLRPLKSLCGRWQTIIRGLASPVTFKPSLRAGLWWWENRDTKECGLHVSAEAKV